MVSGWVYKAYPKGLDPPPRTISIFSEGISVWIGLRVSGWGVRGGGLESLGIFSLSKTLL